MNGEKIIEKDEIFDDIDTNYDKDLNEDENASEQSRHNMSLSNLIYRFITLLGFETKVFFGKHLVKFLRTVFSPIGRLFDFIKFVVIYFIEFIRKANKNVINETANFFNDIKVARMLVKQNNSASKFQKEKTLTLLVRFYKTAVQKHRQFLKRASSYILPLIMLPVLITVVLGFTQRDFALEVTYNNTNIGYIADENVFRLAKNILKQRLEIGGEEFDENIVSQPEYKIKVVNLSELSDANDICEQIIANSDSGLTTACGIYVDNKFIGSVKNESDASSVFKSYIKAYCNSNGIDPDNPQVMLDLVEKVSYIQGLYSEKTLIDSDDLREYLLTHSKSEISKYTVGKNDTAQSICSANNITPEQFFAINPNLDSDSKIKKGESINIIRSIPFINVTVSKTETKTKKIGYKTIEIKTDSLYQGITKVINPGSDGEKKVVTLATFVDGKKISEKEISSTVTKKAVDKKVYVGTKPVPNNVTIYGSQSGAFIWPTVGANTVTSGFGYRYIFGSSSFHRGVDIAGSGASGKPVVASASGVVEKVTSSNTGYGYSVVIDHGNGIKTRYAHCQAGSICVKSGQSVVQGQMIAKVGNTGNSTGPHLHFEIIYNGSYANPLKYLTR